MLSEETAEGNLTARSVLDSLVPFISITTLWVYLHTAVISIDLSAEVNPYRARLGVIHTSF